jgi:hypothetical protein
VLGRGCRAGFWADDEAKAALSSGDHDEGLVLDPMVRTGLGGSESQKTLSLGRAADRPSKQAYSFEASILCSWQVQELMATKNRIVPRCRQLEESILPSKSLPSMSLIDSNPSILIRTIAAHRADPDKQVRAPMNLGRRNSSLVVSMEQESRPSLMACSSQKGLKSQRAVELKQCRHQAVETRPLHWMACFTAAGTIRGRRSVVGGPSCPLQVSDDPFQRCLHSEPPHPSSNLFHLLAIHSPTTPLSHHARPRRECRRMSERRRGSVSRWLARPDDPQGIARQWPGSSGRWTRALPGFPAATELLLLAKLCLLPAPVAAADLSTSPPLGVLFARLRLDDPRLG